MDIHLFSSTSGVFWPFHAQRGIRQVSDINRWEVLVIGSLASRAPPVPRPKDDQKVSPWECSS